ncbi:MAG: hypothetical protein AAB791_03455 [Patescibacteria group bacterium]
MIKKKDLLRSLPDEALQKRLSTPWPEFTHVGRIKRPPWWQWRQRRKFRLLVKKLKNDISRELATRSRLVDQKK